MAAVLNAVDKMVSRIAVNWRKTSLPEKPAFRKSKTKKRDGKCSVNLKSKCHVRKRKRGLKPSDETLFRKEKGLVEKEAI